MCYRINVKSCKRLLRISEEDKSKVVHLDWPFRRNFRFADLKNELHRRYSNLANKRFQLYKPTALPQDVESTVYHGGRTDYEYRSATWKILNRKAQEEARSLHPVHVYLHEN